MQSDPEPASLRATAEPGPVSRQANSTGVHGRLAEPVDRGEREWHGLPRRAMRAMMIGDALVSAGLLAADAAFAAVCLVTDGWWNRWTQLAAAVAAVLFMVLLLCGLVGDRYAMAFRRFSVGERDVRIRRGWIFRSSVTVPYNRVQHVDTTQGPVQRAFGLMTVQVHTAAGEHEIEGLDIGEARRVVDAIAARAREAKEDL